MGYQRTQYWLGGWTNKNNACTLPHGHSVLYYAHQKENTTVLTKPHHSSAVGLDIPTLSTPVSTDNIHKMIALWFCTLPAQ